MGDRPGHLEAGAAFWSQSLRSDASSCSADSTSSVPGGLPTRGAPAPGRPARPPVRARRRSWRGPRSTGRRAALQGGRGSALFAARTAWACLPTSLSIRSASRRTRTSPCRTESPSRTQTSATRPPTVALSDSPRAAAEELDGNGHRPDTPLPADDELGPARAAQARRAGEQDDEERERAVDDPRRPGLERLAEQGAVGKLADQFVLHDPILPFFPGLRGYAAATVFSSRTGRSTRRTPVRPSRRIRQRVAYRPPGGEQFLVRARPRRPGRGGGRRSDRRRGSCSGGGRRGQPSCRRARCGGSPGWRVRSRCRWWLVGLVEDQGSRAASAGRRAIASVLTPANSKRLGAALADDRVEPLGEGRR